MLILEDREIVWDEKKNQNNIRNHGISFNEAAFVFIDPYLVVVFDETHSSSEEIRWKGIGQHRLEEH